MPQDVAVTWLAALATAAVLALTTAHFARKSSLAACSILAASAVLFVGMCVFVASAIVW